MLKQKNNLLLIIILFFILGALISAFIIEYVLGHKPCNLCIYERIPYIFSVFLIITILFSSKYEKITLLILGIVFIFSGILALYHLGIEQGFINESFVCKSKTLSGSLSKEQILEQLKQNNISCKDVSFKILGLSLATINSIFSFFLSVIFVKLYLSHGKNR